MILDLPSRQLDLSAPVVMGVLNLTPDSFSDGGRHTSLGAAIAHAHMMCDEGAAIIDVGGESTRPGAAPVHLQEELDRVVPVIERLCRELDCIISIDSMKPAVMQAACSAGASMVNDVNALRAEGAIDVVKARGVAACLMHMQGEPRSMQAEPRYDDVVTEVHDFLAERVAACLHAGIPRSRLLVDPGFGFGKSLQHNLSLFAHLKAVSSLGLPVMIGVSRKGMLGQILNLPVDQRLNAGLAAAAIAVWQGVHIIRTHDVRATVEALKFAAAVRAVTA